MKRRSPAIGLLALGAMAAAGVLAPAEATAQPFAYVANGTAGSVSVIDLGTRTIVASIPVPRPDPAFEPSTLQPTFVTLNPSGTRAYVTHSHGFSVIDTATRTVLGGRHIGGAHSAALSPDGSRLYVLQLARLDVFDANTNERIGDWVNLPTYLPWRIAIAPDGRRAYISSLSDNAILVVDTETRSVTDTLSMTGRPVVVELSSDGSRLYVGHDGSQRGLTVIDTATHDILAEVSWTQTREASRSAETGAALTLPTAARIR